MTACLMRLHGRAKSVRTCHDALQATQLVRHDNYVSRTQLCTMTYDTMTVKLSASVPEGMLCRLIM